MVGGRLQWGKSHQTHCQECEPGGFHLWFSVLRPVERLWARESRMVQFGRRFENETYGQAAGGNTRRMVPS